jgi:hypothetical protein
MSESIQSVAARCLEDARFALRVLEGSEHPEVKAAIIADLRREGEVQGFFNPQPEPPGRSRFAAEPDWWLSRWASMQREQLKRLVNPAK